MAESGGGEPRDTGLAEDGFHHLPVMLGAVLELLAVRAGGTYVDGTTGGGGHGAAILEAAPGVSLIGLDRDPAALAAARPRLEAAAARSGGRVTLVRGSFGDLAEHLESLGVSAIDGLLVDLGVSSPQLDVAERGFSFQRAGPLDMRMDPDGEVTAADLVNDRPVEALEAWFRDYGEERHARLVARAVVERRGRKPFETTTELAELVSRVVSRFGPPGGKGRIHPATRVFQALRIAVNDELGEVERLLPQAVGALREGGRIAVISFHSLEDRIVKQGFRAEAEPCICPPDFPICACGRVARLKVLTRRPVEASEDEVRQNPRARSARLRAAERVGAA